MTVRKTKLVDAHATASTSAHARVQRAIEARNREARRQALNHEYERSFETVEELGAWMDAL